jgi:hypothetical protein
MLRLVDGASHLLNMQKEEDIMAGLEFSDREVNLVREILESYFADLRMEIAGTDNKEMRDALKEKEQEIKDILDRLANA